MVLGEEEAGREGGGGCDTIVVFELLSEIVELRPVEDVRLAGTDLYVVLSFTLISKRPEGRDATRTTASGDSASSDLKITVRS
jgi:hypothetical protein